MTEPKPITIVGGGLAGLTLGIALRQRGAPVTLWEAGRFPRHRVCGEFISGRGLETLRRLDLFQLIERAGATSAQTAAFFNCRWESGVKQLPSPALCISRFMLDDTLAREFRRLGGELREGRRWNEAAECEGVVRATGRRATPTENGWRWFGLKTHARGVRLSADLEMHVSPDGYVGMCRLPDDTVNVCGLFRRRAGEEGGATNWREILSGPKDSRLIERLSGASLIEESFCSVAGLSLKPDSASAHGGCCIGDAITMIPPVTGNGMSMALESAELSIAPLMEWSLGIIPWERARRRVAKNCDEAFRRRLTWAGRLQSLMLPPLSQRALIWLTARNDWFWRAWFARTR